nr:PREDICTED: uncharacterized protein LOC103314524 isoform X1 [Tribolium castaneum]|eukprot:XP_015840867.1 PREDICTED: uncharacterized protein LOC103314524 isoform X1 [Tribolium castaneum]
MEFVETTLKSWGFDSLVEVFQANDVDYEVFLSLSEEMIKELIPKVRLRYKFKQRYTQFQQKNLILTIDTSNVQAFEVVDENNEYLKSFKTILKIPAYCLKFKLHRKVFVSVRY